MPTYVFRCPEHGPAEVYIPVALYDDLKDHVACDVCLTPMIRVFTPQNFIMRPSGWNLRPGADGYSFFDRERELGELREVGETDLHGRVEDEALPEAPLPEPDPRQVQEIHELGRTIDRQIREEMDLPQAILDLAER